MIRRFVSLASMLAVGMALEMLPNALPLQTPAAAPGVQAAPEVPSAMVNP